MIGRVHKIIIGFIKLTESIRIAIVLENVVSAPWIRTDLSIPLKLKKKKKKKKDNF